MKHNESICDLTISQIIKLKEQKNIPDYALVVLDNSNCWYEGDIPSINLNWHTYENGSFLEDGDNIKFYFTYSTKPEYGTIQINKYNEIGIIPKTNINVSLDSIIRIYKI